MWTNLVKLVTTTWAILKQYGRKYDTFRTRIKSDQRNGVVGEEDKLYISGGSGVLT